MAISWYTTVKAPFGTICAVVTGDRIALIRPEKPPCVSAAHRHAMPLLAHTADELRAYFEGRSCTLSIPFPDDLPPFANAVYSRIARIPYGTTVDAAQLCEECGIPHAVHAVRMLCISNPLWIVIPCHRVVFEKPLYDRSCPIAYEEALRQLEKRYADTLTKPLKEGKL